MITLKEAKNYLRVDYEEDDSLIQNLLSTAKNLVMDVGRMDESRLLKMKILCGLRCFSHLGIFMKTGVILIIINLH